MLNKVKNALKHYFRKDFCQFSIPNEDSFDLKNTPLCYFKSFGKRNPNKIFYVIWLDHMGSGFFSNVSNVLCHLKIAESLGMIPVIDFQNFKTLYHESREINKSDNSWEYYFKPVSAFELEEVYESKNVCFCGGLYPPFMSYNITEINGLYENIYTKYLFLQNNVLECIEKYSELFVDNRILGVHFRGKEQNLAPGHSFGPTEKQMLRCTDEIIEKYNIDKIFFVTEEQKYLDIFIERYGDKIIYSESFRTYKVNSYNLSPREDHRYLLGLDVLIDATILSLCNGMLCSDSNVSEYARFINNKKYEFVYKIDNGVNSNNFLIAMFLYRIKKWLPHNFGGLLNNINIL